MHTERRRRRREREGDERRQMRRMTKRKREEEKQEETGKTEKKISNSIFASKNVRHTLDDVLHALMSGEDP